MARPRRPYLSSGVANEDGRDPSPLIVSLTDADVVVVLAVALVGPIEGPMEFVEQWSAVKTIGGGVDAAEVAGARASDEVT